MLHSKFVLSLSMVGLLCISVFDLNVKPKFAFKFNSDLRSNLNKLLSQPVFWVFSLVFWLVLFGGLYSENFSYWIERLRIKLPYLLLPFAFVSLPRLKRKTVDGLFSFFILLMTITCIWVMVNYLQNFEAFNLLVRQGKHIPVPSNHVRFSLLLALCILFGVNLFFTKFYIFRKWEIWLTLVSTIFLFLVIHVLSVRSGLVVLYAGLLTATIRWLFISKKFLLGIGALSFLFLIPFAGYQIIPSFKNKVDYARWDIDSYMKGNFSTQRSDTGRLRSMKIGYDVFKANPVFGIGTGDLKDEVYKIYDEKYPEAFKKTMPHNQFISVAASSGIIGLGVFCFAIFFPFFYKGNYKDYYIIVVFQSIILSFLVENTIGNALGVSIHTFFMLLLINHLTPKSSEPS